MASGTIARLQERGFGFIAPDGGAARDDLFFHHTALTGTSFDQLREGQRVSYDAEPDPRDSRRQRAVNVQPTADERADEPPIAL
jgi:CspA family cold shock protein